MCFVVPSFSCILLQIVVLQLMKISQEKELIFKHIQTTEHFFKKKVFFSFSVKLYFFPHRICCALVVHSLMGCLNGWLIDGENKKLLCDDTEEENLGHARGPRKIGIFQMVSEILLSELDRNLCLQIC